jgi:hypothetical protein
MRAGSHTRRFVQDKSVSLFSKYLENVIIADENMYESESKAVCPYVFKNAFLDSIEVAYQVDSFLYASLFRFQEINHTITFSINSSVQEFVVGYGYNFKFDTGLFQPLVFKNVTTLRLFGAIKSIQTDLFKNFRLLTYFGFYLNNYGNFFHQIGIEWMNFLNNNSAISFSSDEKCGLDYTYPNSDFCIFAQFPFNRIIYLFLEDSQSNNHPKSFTYTWLCMYGQIASNSCLLTNVNWTVLNEMVKLCRLEKNETNRAEGLNSYALCADCFHTLLLEMLFFELVPFVFIPCACIIGLFLNWKIFQTINQNIKKELKEDFYKYMSANAKFNCIYCIIFVFYPMTSCELRLSTNFCSSVFTNLFVQYFKIIVMTYFGEVIQMCANISYIMMTLNRYLLVGKDHPPWLVSIAKLEFKWVIRGSFLFSALLNIGHGWE